MNIETTLTGWHGLDQPPVRVGPYNVRTNTDDPEVKFQFGYSFWDGANWGPLFEDVEYTVLSPVAKSPPGTYEWRGLATEADEDKL